MSLNFSRFQSSQSINPHKQSDFFHESFYKQKVNIEDDKKTHTTYNSYEYVKKYFIVTRLTEVVNKIIKETLDSNYLPQNPYNMIGRLLLHESIFENTKLFYIINQSQIKKKGLLTFQYRNLKIQSQTKITSAQYVMVQIRIDKMKDYQKKMRDSSNKLLSNNTSFITGWRLRPLLRHQIIEILWYQLVQKRKNYEQILLQKKGSKKNKKIQNIQNSLGGSILFRIGCPYSTQNIASVYQFVYTGYFQSLQHHAIFANYIIDDCIKFCQGADNIFIKLSIKSYDQSITEWSSQNLIHNRVKISKQIEKHLIYKRVNFEAQCVCRVQDRNIRQLGMEYIKYKKIYVLVQEQDPRTINIYTLSPVYILLTSIHRSDCLYYQALNKNHPTTAQQLTHIMHEQLHYQIISHLANQQIPLLCWNLFYYDLFDHFQNQNNSKQLKILISYIIQTPLDFIEELKYRFNIIKLISSRSSISSHQNQIYDALQRCQQILRFHLRKQDHVYAESVLFLDGCHKNIEALLENRKSKKLQQNIKMQIQRMQSIFRYLMNSFYQVTFVLKGYLLSEIIRIDNTFGKEGSGQVINTTLTYDIFLRKFKNLAEKSLNLPKQIKQLRKNIKRSDDEIKQLILAKYVKNYNLYQQIYQFYWNLASTKKPEFPLTKLASYMRHQAIRLDSKTKRKQHQHANIQQSKTDGIMIYQKSADTRNEHIFYSFSIQALQDTKVKDFRVVKEVFQDFFQGSNISLNSIDMFGSQRNSSIDHKNSIIISLDSNIRHGSWQEANFNHCKLYADIIHHTPIPHTQIYRLMYEQIKIKIMQLDKKGFGIVGIYCGEQQLIDEDRVYAWTEQDQKFDINFIRYQSKKQINYQSLAKLIGNCQKKNDDLVIKSVFWLNGLLKICTISFNFLINKVWLLNKANSYKDRIFQTNQNIIRWGNYNGLKKHLQTQKKIRQNSNYDRKLSMRDLYFENHIDMIEFVAVQTDEKLSISRVRTYSPFYAKLQQAKSITQGLFYMLQYMKTDRQGKFQLQDYKETLQILEYYLFEKCLKQDRYIYSEGLSVMSVNLISRIKSYISQHRDNNGTQKQIIFLQKITVKLINCINHCMVSCAFGVLQAMRSEYAQDSDDDQ